MISNWYTRRIIHVPWGPYGAAGCGEGPLAAPHPAILNAIYNATGARITRVPALPEVVKGSAGSAVKGKSQKRARAEGPGIFSR